MNFIGRVIYNTSYEKRALGFVCTLLCSLTLVVFAFWASINVIQKGLVLYDNEQQSILDWNANAEVNTPAEPEAETEPAVTPEAAA